MGIPPTESGPRRPCRTSRQLAIPVSIQRLMNWRLTQTPYNPDLERTHSRSDGRGSFRRERNLDISREGRLLAESRSGEAGYAGSVREGPRISLGMVSRAPPTDSQCATECGA